MICVGCLRTEAQGAWVFCQDCLARESWMEQERQAHHDQRPYHGPDWTGRMGRLSATQRETFEQVCERLIQEGQ